MTTISSIIATTHKNPRSLIIATSPAAHLHAST